MDKFNAECEKEKLVKFADTALNQPTQEGQDLAKRALCEEVWTLTSPQLRQVAELMPDWSRTNDGPAPRHLPEMSLVENNKNAVLGVNFHEASGLHDVFVTMPRLPID